MTLSWAKPCTVDMPTLTLMGGPFFDNVKAWVTFLYGPRDPILTPAGWTGDFHYGLDLWPEGFGDGTGCLLLALGDGKVTHIWDDPAGMGNAVEVEYVFGGKLYAVRYLHMNTPAFATVGDLVHAGAFLGMVGSTGMANGAHLHMEVRVTDNFYIQDPLLFLLDCPDIGEVIDLKAPLVARIKADVDTLATM